jgi:hypothetical protein
MKKTLIFLYIVLLAFTVMAQKENHKWKPLQVDENKKIWFDLSQVDTLTQARFDIWMLELHKPMLKIEGVPGQVMRTKTLYSINMEEAFYGIKEVVYYDINNKEIKRYRYGLQNYPEDMKYTFPITKDTDLHLFINELSRMQGQRN